MEPMGALNLSLYGWFSSRPACCCKIRVWSATGICLLVNWSLWVQISLADRPRERIRVVRRAVATARSVGEIGSPCGSCLSSSSSSSCMARSATGFLFGFLARPSSNIILCRPSSSSLTSDLKAGAGSIRISAEGPSRGHNSAHSWIRALRRVALRSSLTRTETV